MPEYVNFEKPDELNVADLLIYGKSTTQRATFTMLRVDYIMAMRRLMQAAHLVPPTFESSREHNEFTARLLLHHFLDEKDLEWLQQFEMFNLNDPQKQSLIFVREVGAIDNLTYRQMADCDTLKASTDLRMLKSCNLFASKGKGKATYYIPGPGLRTEPTGISTQPPLDLSTQPTEISTQPTDLRTPPPDLRTPPLDLRTPPPSINSPVLIDESLQKEIDSLKQREHDSDKIKGIIMEICKDRYLSAKQISTILNREEDYIKRKYLSKMIKSRNLVYLHAEMINHPEQAYITFKHP